VYGVVAGIPALVSAEQEQYSDVPSDRWEAFLAMKQRAYGSRSFVGWLYNHYHRYAAERRRDYGACPLTVDVGFGIGEHAPFVSADELLAASFIGIDLDRRKIAWYRATGGEIPVIQASAGRLPFADGSIDVVQMLAVLEHFPPGGIGAIVAEAVRVLRPGGGLIACYPAEGSPLLRVAQKIMHSYLRSASGFDLEHEGAHYHPATAADVRRALAGSVELTCRDSRRFPLGRLGAAGTLFFNETYCRQ
jgi:SAM-dependent methyltransferase